MIKLKFRSFEYLFQIIRIEREVKTKMIIQIFSINKLENIQPGMLMVLYHAKPGSAKGDAAEAVIITKRGINK